MTRFVTFPFTALVLLPLFGAPAMAQASDRPGPGWGWNNGFMWGPMGGGWGWHPGMMIGGIMMLLVLVALVLLIVWLVRALSHGHGSGYGSHHHGSALDILAERFARGEIDKEEFEEKRRLLLRR